ncbi:hypothetical protein ABIC65_002460 [Sphingomonas trueperi]|uniref:hypothetical protein n=1 Tax=Sphingomonas trueperi TaxID=53317 RepID=UPI0033978F30
MTMVRDFQHDRVGQVDQPQEQRGDVVMTIAAGYRRLVRCKAEHGQHGASALLEQRLGGARLDALADRVVARRLRFGRHPPEVRTANGMGDHQP